MKRAFNIITTLFFVGILSIGTTAFAEEVTKEYHKTWKTSEIESLWITNKFGEVKVTNNSSDKITIDVKITVEAGNKKRTDELLKSINVSFSKNGTVVKATTSMECNCKGKQKFSIDYVVNIPENKNLRIQNKYGNTIINRLTGNGDFDIQYGNFTANELTGEEIRIALAYGNSTVSKAADLTVQVKYSPMNFDEIKNLKLYSKYSDITVGDAMSVFVDSKYDKLSFEKVETVKAETKYSHLKIEELIKSLKIDAGYGSVKVDEVAKDFDEISITNSYGQISLGLYDASYSVIATCRYCGISYPEDKFTGNKIKENNTRRIDGEIGQGKGGKVKIESRYGDIKLRD